MSKTETAMIPDGNDLIGSRIAGGNSAYKRMEQDFYPTPDEVTIALMNYLQLPKGTRIWEPACGDGQIVQLLNRLGYWDVIGTDILEGEDFLTAPLPPKTGFILTNPPFSLAEEFIRRGWQHRVPFALLLKNQFWNAKKRYPLFLNCQPTVILPLTWRPDFLFKTRGKGSPLMDVIWCVWTDFFPHITRYVPIERPVVEDEQSDAERFDDKSQQITWF